MVATLAGELDGAETESVRARLLAALPSEARGLVCDLSSLSYIDSAGVHLLHRLARALQAEDQRTALVLPTRPTPRHVLESLAALGLWRVGSRRQPDNDR